MICKFCNQEFVNYKIHYTRKNCMNLNCGYTLFEIYFEDVFRAYIVCMCATFIDIYTFIHEHIKNIHTDPIIYIEFCYGNLNKKEPLAIFNIFGQDEYSGQVLSKTTIFSLDSEIDLLELSQGDTIKISTNNIRGYLKVINVVPDECELTEIVENENDINDDNNKNDDYYENVIEVFIEKYV